MSVGDFADCVGVLEEDRQTDFWETGAAATAMVGLR
jgi:hypothetical protein